MSLFGHCDLAGNCQTVGPSVTKYVFILSIDLKFLQCGLDDQGVALDYLRWRICHETKAHSAVRCFLASWQWLCCVTPDAAVVWRVGPRSKNRLKEPCRTGTDCDFSASRRSCSPRPDCC